MILPIFPARGKACLALTRRLWRTGLGAQLNRSKNVTQTPSDLFQALKYWSWARQIAFSMPHFLSMQCVKSWNQIISHRTSTYWTKWNGLKWNFWTTGHCATWEVWHYDSVIFMYRRVLPNMSLNNALLPFNECLQCEEIFVPVWVSPCSNKNKHLNIYIIFVAGTVLSTLYVLAHFVLTLALQATYYYPHLPDADTKQRI